MRMHRWLIFASLAIISALSYHTPAFAELERHVVIAATVDTDALAVPWTDVSVVVPDAVQVDTLRKLDAFGAIYFKTNDIRQPASTDVECYQHIDPGRLIV